MRPEDSAKSDVFREKIGRPSAEEQAKHLSVVFPPLRNRYLTALNRDISGELTFPGILEVQKRELEASYRKPSRPYLCAMVIRDLAEVHWEKAFEELNRKDIAGFRFDYDFACGLAYPIGRIIMCEAELGGELDSLLVPVITKISDKTEGVGNEAGEYLLHKKTVEVNVAMLQQDPTGVSLVCEEVEGLKRHGNPPRGWSLVYLIAGAELSRDLYQGLYQIAGKLYS